MSCITITPVAGIKNRLDLYGGVRGAAHIMLLKIQKTTVPAINV